MYSMLRQPQESKKTYRVVLGEVQETAVTPYTIDAEATQTLRGKLGQ